MNNKKIKERIKIARVEKKLTLQEMADKLEIGYNTYVAIEVGSTNIVNPRLEKIAEILGKTEGYFLFGGNEPSNYDLLEPAPVYPSYQDRQSVTKDLCEEQYSKLLKEIEGLDADIKMIKTILVYMASQLNLLVQKE